MGVWKSANLLFSAIAISFLGTHPSKGQTIEEMLQRPSNISLEEMLAQARLPIEKRLSQVTNYDDLAGVKFPLSNSLVYSPEFLALARSQELPVEFIKEITPFFANGFWLEAGIEDVLSLRQFKVPISYVAQIKGKQDTKCQITGVDIAKLYGIGTQAQTVIDLCEVGFSGKDILHLQVYNVPSDYATSFKRMKGQEDRFGPTDIVRFRQRNIQPETVANFLRHETKKRHSSSEMIAYSIEHKIDAKFAFSLNGVHGIKFEDIKLLSEDEISADYIWSFRPNDSTFQRFMMASYERLSIADTMYILSKSNVTAQFMAQTGNAYKDSFGDPIFAAPQVAFLFRNQEKYSKAYVQKALSLFEGRFSSLGAATTCLLSRNLVSEFSEYLRSNGKTKGNAADVDAFTYERNKAAMEKAGYLREPDNQSNRPKAILWLPRSDWNCAFYHTNVSEDLQALNRHFDFYVSFAATPDDFKQYQQKFDGYDLLIDAGHGSQWSISKTEKDLRLESGTGSQGVVKKDDPHLASYTSKLSKSGTRLLYSCSNAEGEDNLAKALAKAQPGVTIIAAKKPSYMTTFSFEPAFSAKHYDLRGNDITSVMQR